jgi:polar amino acid transport system substrate-binding protein
MRKVIIAIAIIFNLSVSAANNPDIHFTEFEKEYIDSNTFTLGMITDNYPFAFQDKGKMSGFSFDYLQLIKMKSGLKIKIEVDNWTNTLSKFKSKKIDLIDLISHSKSREAFTNFTEPYFEIPSVIFAKEGDFKDYHGFESLKGKKIGITKDLYYYDDVKKLNLFELVDFDNSRDKMKALAYGKVDAIFNNLITGQRYIKSFGFSNISIIGELDNQIVKKEDLRIGVKKEDFLLFSIIKKSIAAISIEEREQLINKWFAAQVKIKTVSEIPFPLTEQEKQYVKEKKVLKMCVSPDRLPFEKINKEGAYTGIASDLIKIISQKINIPIILTPTTEWSTSLQNIKDRKCDILPVVMKGASQSEGLNFTHPYISEPLVIVTKLDKLFIPDIESIGQHKVGILKSAALSKRLKAKYPEINLISVENVKEGLSKVKSGELYGYIGLLSAIGYNIQNNYYIDLKIAGKLDENVDISIASRNDEVLLNSVLQKTLNNIGQAKIRTIVGEWIKVTVEQSVDYLKLLYISSFFIVIVLLILNKNIAINKVNKKLALLNKEIEEKNKALKELARTDKLTGLYNRVKLDETLISEVHRANRFNHSFGVVMIDIDYFKKVNDDFGHQVGDTVLQEFSKVLQSNARNTDILGRWGGEEFLIISTETDLAGVLTLANKLQQKIASFPFSYGEQKTASFGVSVYRENENIHEVIKRADNALYRAKKNGRNRVEKEAV